MKLSPNWKTNHARYSVKVLALGAAVTTAWMGVPDDLKHALPGWLPTAVACSIFVLGLLGAYLAQPSLNGDDATTTGGNDAANHS